MSQPALKQLSTGEILDVSFGLYRQLFGPLLMVQIVCSSLPFLLNVYATAAGENSASSVLVLLNYVLSFVLGALATAATCHLISERYLGRTISASDALRRAGPRIGPLMVLSLMVGLVTVISAVPFLLVVGVSIAGLATAGFNGGFPLVVFGFGLLLLALPIAVFSGVSVGTQCLVYEPQLDAGRAMSRSWFLTKGFKGRIVALLLTFALLFAVPIGGVLTLLRLGLGAGDATGAEPWQEVIIVVATSLVAFVVTPLLYCMLTLVYYDLRVRKEGFDLELLERGLEAA